MNTAPAIAEASPPVPAAPRTRTPLAVFVVLCSIVSGLVLTEQVSNNVLPLTLHRFTPDAQLIGLVLALNPFFGFIVQPLVGVLSDRVWTPLGRRAVFLVTCAPIVAFCLFFIPHSPALWQIVVLVVLYQFFQDVLYGSDHPLIADLVPPHRRTLVKGCMAISTQSASFLFLKFGVGAESERFGETIPYYVAAAAQMLLVAGAALCLKEQRHQAIDRPRLTPRRYVADLFGDPVRRRFGILAFVHAMFLAVINGFIVLFAVDTVHLKRSEFADIWSLHALVALGCAIPLGLLAERWPKQRVLVAGYALVMVACIIGYRAEHASAFVAITLLFGLGHVMLDVTLKPFFTEYVPRDIVGQVTGAYNICFAIGRSVALVGGGWLVSRLGTDYRVIWPAGLALGVVAIALASQIPDERYARRKAATLN